MDVLSYRPDPAEFAWTFGGVPPVRRVRPGSILELWTEDAFGGRVRGPDDLVSRVVRGPLVAGPRRPRRQHGHPRDAGRRHLLPGCQRRGGAVLDRRRPLPAGPGRELR